MDMIENSIVAVFAVPQTITEYSDKFGIRDATARSRILRWCVEGLLFEAGKVRLPQGPPAMRYCSSRETAAEGRREWAKIDGEPLPTLKDLIESRKLLRALVKSVEQLTDSEGKVLGCPWCGYNASLVPPIHLRDDGDPPAGHANDCQAFNSDGSVRY